MVYGRKRGDWPSGDQDRRGIPLHRSENWDDVTWDTVGDVVIDPEDVFDYGEDVRPDLYTPNVQPYYGQYIAMPATFFRDDNRVPASQPDRTTGPLYPLFTHSLDGENWEFPDLEQSILDLTPHERVSTHPQATSYDLEVGQIYPNSNLLEVGDELLMYYRTREDTHYEAHPSMSGRSNHVASMRIDGFASLKADGINVGEWLTATVEVPSDAEELYVNADIDGDLKVEVIDPGTGSPVSGLSISDSVAFSGDSTGTTMSWSSGEIGDVAGDDVQLRFEIDDGAIFSFWFNDAWN